MDKGVIELWYGEVQKLDCEDMQYWPLLNTAERAKAESMKNIGLRSQYIAVRGKLRMVLAQYTDIAAQNITYRIGDYGKPALAAIEDIHFNISHSGSKLIIAVAAEAMLGVDIEVWNAKRKLQKLADRCFSPQEIQAWELLQARQKISVFYRTWTIKEAFVKAVGRGMALGLDQCVTEFAHGNRFLQVPKDFQPASDWQVIQLDLGDSVSGAVVIKGQHFSCQQSTILF